MTDNQPLDLDAIETAARNAARIGSGIHPDTAIALVAEVRRLRARLWELERPSTEAERDALRQSFMELAAQAREDRDFEGAFEVQCRLRDREEQWKREDAAAGSAAANEEQR
ncbi:hypothetical protein [Streptomyces sp. NPDC008240]|uniref:hypothetical protein n=1 Tax=Streptomyces sp. NPDC008240 TaxID=3364822 RepID=UPI0036E8920A